MGDPLDEHDESENSQPDEEGKEPGTTERGPNASGQESAFDEITGHPTNRERVRGYDRDHPGQTVRQVAAALGIDHGSAARFRRGILKEQKLAATRAGGTKAAELAEGGATGEGPPVTERAEAQAESKIATHLSDALTKRTNDAMDEILETGERIRNWYMGKGFAADPRFPTPGAFVDEVLQFWWKNRDVIQQLRETVTELRERVIEQNAYIRALNIYIDPDRLYARQVDQILSYATECQLAGVKLDRVIWERLLDHAETYRDAMRAHPSHP